jgi:hypothetical protein
VNAALIATRYTALVLGLPFWHAFCYVQHVKSSTLTIVSCIVFNPLWAAEPNPRDLVAQSIVNYEKDWKATLSYAYTERDVSKDPNGRAKSSEMSHVSVIDGTPYSRLVAKNGHPLGPEEARKEEEKYRKAIHARDSETPEQKARRINKYLDERGFLHEIPDAFNMKLLGHEMVDGRPNYVIELTPKPGYVPKSKNARIFPDIEGKLWIDEQDLRWTKAEANVISNISIGWVLARIGPGAHITLSQTKVDGEHWMPKRIDVTGSARIMLVKNRNIDETLTYEDYHRIGKGNTTVTAKNP